MSNKSIHSNKNTNTINKVNKNTKNTKNSSYNNVKMKYDIKEQKKQYYLIPIFFVLCIIPLIVKGIIYNPKLTQFSWFPNNRDSVVDLFLYYKQRWFIIISFIIAFATTIKLIYIRKSIKLPKIFIPLVVYAILILLSTVFSKYSSYSFTGSYEMFESVFALLGYCLIVYYIFLFLEEERDFKMIVYFVAGVAILQGILGVFQFLGYDFFTTQVGKDLIIPSDIRPFVQTNMVFGKKIVYLTLFNPNYVGVYAALVTPILFVLLVFQKKIVNIILLLCSVIGLVISAIGSHSLAGVIGLGTAIIVIIVFMWRYLKKHPIIIISLAGIFVFGIVFIVIYSNHYYLDKFQNALKISKTEYALEEMHTEQDGVTLTYKNNELKIKGTKENDSITSLSAYDQNNRLINAYYDASTKTYNITDERFTGLVYGWDTEITGAFYISADGLNFKFLYLTQDGKCYYINSYNQLDQMITAPSSMFQGYGSFASGRGYIWSRTIPMLKDYIILGSGPDTYTLVYPQQDYLNMIRYGFDNQILTKPHNMYLQIAVQTGVLSLIAFLVFYGMYFVSSVSLYIRGRFTSYYAKFGVAVFIGTFCYMVTGLTNDSNINTAPIFWTLMGVGISLNFKAKPLIQKEIAEIKTEKENKSSVSEKSGNMDN